MTDWTTADIEDQQGRVAVITGANTGIGLETARVLAQRGATVVLACRDKDKAERAAAGIGGSTRTYPLDLTSLDSIRAAAQRIRDDFPRIDLLIDNAGVMMTPPGHTADGYELQLGTNHLGHFAFTGLLLDRMMGVPGSRVVVVSSSANRQGAIDLADLHFRQRKYTPAAAYGQSKLANLLFARELNDRLAVAGAETISIAMEPGVTPTELRRYVRGATSLAIRVITRLFGQPDAAAGARVVLRAATDPQTRGGDYYAPDGRPPLRARGNPIRIAPVDTDAHIRRELWAESIRLTGVDYGTLTHSVR
ncbi:oxidoreductase [Nocardia alni]|uniref:oxidoreductase n=1 Tax=Nocardia alni TaxID=2815723 RepID=UPI001C22262D|nr:oxidoreductase [Nocardia alni]